MELETTFPHWLLRAVLIGFFGGAFALSTIALLTAQSSDFFDPGTEAFFGGFIGAVGGAVVGFLVWAIAALVVLVRLTASRLKARR